MLEQETQKPVKVVLRYDAASVLLPMDQEILVGRSPGCFISLDDPNVSRVHFRIRFPGGDAVVIEDNGSKNGTFVNGERIDGQHLLQDGDEVAVGARVFVVGFISAEPENVDITPVPVERSARTLQGVGVPPQVAIGERCPRCRGHVPVQATSCATCGFEWRRGSKRAPTSQEDAVESESPMQRRRDRRFPVSIPARVASSSWEGQGNILNLSVSGAFIATSHAVSVGSTCVLEVRSYDNAVVTLDGFVRHAIHRGDKGMGVEFTELTAEAIDWIRNRVPMPH